MGDERRKHKRFSATAFLNRPVYFFPLPPYFGHSAKGKLIDLSAGGMSVLVGELIPQETMLNLKVTFPDHSSVESIVKIRYVIPHGRDYLHGIEFLTITSVMSQKIEKMSSDYIDCESRIQSRAHEICRTDCAFFSMCTKKEKLDPMVNMDAGLSLELEALRDPHLTSSPPTESR